MIAAAANLAWLGAQAGVHRRFCRQLGSPEETQANVLKELLHRNAKSAFGLKHGFAAIRMSAEFAEKVPLSTYEDLSPWIDRIKSGEQGVLTVDPVTRLIPTSGSAGARKLIPFTVQLQREFDTAIGPWIFDLYTANPHAIFGPSYWSISPNVSGPETEKSVVPIGFDDDTSYLGGAKRRLVAATMAAPSALRMVPEIETFLLLTLVCLLRRRDLRLISIWHPTFLSLLLDTLPRHWDAACEIIRTARLPSHVVAPQKTIAALRLQALPRRAKELRRLGPSQINVFWPKLEIISCWTDANAATSAGLLSARFPNVTLQSKGLLATEAFVSLPFRGRHPVAIGSHYFEFLDEDDRLHSISALRENQIYEVIVTTGGGLWRYRLGDRVQVDGFVLRTPSLRFVGRPGEFNDLCGEKLSGEFVGSVIGKLDREHKSGVRFAMLAPDTHQSPTAYVLYWEGDSTPTTTDLETLLCENPNYAWCRKLGQLFPARIFIIRRNAVEDYYRRASERQKFGDIKIPFLSRTAGWNDWFTGNFRE